MKRIIVCAIILTTKTMACDVSYDLVRAIEQVESNGNPSAVGDNGRAIGCLQIWKVVVDDCNRIEGCKRWSYADRWSRTRSFQMARIYLEHYGNWYEKKYHKQATPEVLARMWNGGAYGWKKKSTEKYWKKVKKEMEEK